MTYEGHQRLGNVFSKYMDPSIIETKAIINDYVIFTNSIYLLNSLVNSLQPGAVSVLK